MISYGAGKNVLCDQQIAALQKQAQSTADILAVIIYGSHGTAVQTPLSDIDVAVLSMPQESDWSLMRELEISAALNETAETDAIQVLNLRQCSVIFQMKVLKTGRLIFCRDEILHADFVELVIKRYCDFSVDYRETAKDFDAGLMEDFTGVDASKLRSKLGFIRRQMRNLRRFQEMGIEEFTSDPLYEAAAIRMLQVAIEAMLDICSHLSAREGWGLPGSYAEAVKLAADNGMIPPELEDSYKAMARIRNRAVHICDDIDSGEILNRIHNHLNDFKPFLRRVTRCYLVDCENSC